MQSNNASERRRRSWEAGATHLCSCIFRVITWWTSCSISATVASGASVTHDRGTGFHLPTWINPKKTWKRERWGQLRQSYALWPYFLFYLWPAPQSCVSSPASAEPSRSAGWRADLSWSKRTRRVLLFSLSPEGFPCAPPRRRQAASSLYQTQKQPMISTLMKQMFPKTCFLPLLCRLLHCGLETGAFWATQGFLAPGLPWLLCSWPEGPAPFCSRRASLAGGGRGSTVGLVPSGFLTPLHRASICGLTLMQRYRCLRLNSQSKEIKEQSWIWLSK